MDNLTPAPFDVSVVVIGRNEAARLPACLHSVQHAAWSDLRWELIYVDSDSTDGSAQIAAQFGARVLGLEGATASAAAARNIGWRAAGGAQILFLDGDTELKPGFVREARPPLAQSEVAAVWGHRREREPRQSIYTRVLDLDWIFAPGRTEYFGGDVLIKRQALASVGGFDDRILAGEEPELCRRLRGCGWQIEHLDLPMTTHDLGIQSARAWWLRAERSGRAYAQIAARFAATPDPLWRRESRRNYLHGGVILLVLALLGGTIARLIVTPSANSWLLLAMAVSSGGALTVLARSAVRARWKCPGDPGLAWFYALHSHLQQVPILVGQLRWLCAPRHAPLASPIDYRVHG